MTFCIALEIYILTKLTLWLLHFIENFPYLSSFELMAQEVWFQLILFIYYFIDKGQDSMTFFIRTTKPAQKQRSLKNTYFQNWWKIDSVLWCRISLIIGLTYISKSASYAAWISVFCIFKLFYKMSFFRENISHNSHYVSTNTKWRIFRNCKQPSCYTQQLVLLVKTKPKSD